MSQTVSWFSAGVSSAVATRLIVDEIDYIFYVHIDDQHPDTLRFVRDCQDWYGKKIEILQSPKKSVDNVVRESSFVNSVYGSPCTKTLKLRVRQKWEQEHPELYPLCYVWGIDKDEVHRAERLQNTMCEFTHRFPLIEQDIGKREAHEILNASGIKRPVMYDLGYHNNNCVGCVKGGMGYWNKIRLDFPDVFEARAKLEREIGASCINGVFLDELDPARGRHKGPIVDDCGIMCEIMSLKHKG